MWRWKSRPWVCAGAAAQARCRIWPRSMRVVVVVVVLDPVSLEDPPHPCCCHAYNCVVGHWMFASTIIAARDHVWWDCPPAGGAVPFDCEPHEKRQWWWLLWWCFCCCCWGIPAAASSVTRKKNGDEAVLVPVIDVGGGPVYLLLSCLEW